MSVIVAILVVLVAVVAAAVLLRARARRRERLATLRGRQRAYIRAYVFPAELARRLRDVHPELSQDDATLTLAALRQFFLACLSARDAGIAQDVGMPSKIVDDAWHEFLLMTRAYHAFCNGAFGEYLHHTPRALLREPHGDALANTLHQLTRPETIIAGSALGASVPRLFTIDRDLHITGGYRYDEHDLCELEHRRRAIVGGGGGEGSNCAVATMDGGGDGACGDGGGGGCGGSCGGGGGCGGS